MRRSQPCQDVGGGVGGDFAGRDNQKCQKCKASVAGMTFAVGWNCQEEDQVDKQSKGEWLVMNLEGGEDRPQTADLAGHCSHD